MCPCCAGPIFCCDIADAAATVHHSTKQTWPTLVHGSRSGTDVRWAQIFSCLEEHSCLLTVVLQIDYDIARRKVKELIAKPARDPAMLQQVGHALTR